MKRYRGRRRLRTSEKLMLGEKVGLFYNGKKQVKLVSEWIESNPQLLFANVYQYKRYESYGARRVQLVKPAETMLLDRIIQVAPELLKFLDRRK